MISDRSNDVPHTGSSNAGACLAVQRADLGLVGHTHVPGAWRQTGGGGAKRVNVTPGVPLPCFVKI